LPETLLLSTLIPAAVNLFLTPETGWWRHGRLEKLLLPEP